DEHGHVIHLGERDCSLQRSHQKLLEVAPAAALSPKLRSQIGDTALNAARAAGYTNAGTLAFLLDRSNNFYFLEMSTRIQVEHPVTEFVTGIDLVRQQILVADGQPLKMHQRDVQIRGHALQCRINAEDAERNFAPCPGRIENLILPGGYGVRVD